MFMWPQEWRKYLKEKNVNVYDIQSISLSVFLALANEPSIFHQETRGQCPRKCEMCENHSSVSHCGDGSTPFPPCKWFLTFPPALYFSGKIMK